MLTVASDCSHLMRRAKGSKLDLEISSDKRNCGAIRSLAQWILAGEEEGACSLAAREDGEGGILLPDPPPNWKVGVYIISIRSSELSMDSGLLSKTVPVDMLSILDRILNARLASADSFRYVCQIDLDVRKMSSSCSFGITAWLVSSLNASIACSEESGLFS